MRIEAEIGDRTLAVVIDEEAGRFRLVVDGRALEGEVLRPEPGVFTFFVGERVVEARVGAAEGSESYRVRVGGRSIDVRVIDRKRRQAGGEAGPEGRQTLLAPMPGKVVALLAAPGDPVERGQGVLVVEAMKMQNELRAPREGTIERVAVGAGATIEVGDLLLVIA